MVDDIFIAERHPANPLSQQGRKGMGSAFSIPVIGETARHAFEQAYPARLLAQ